MPIRHIATWLGLAMGTAAMGQSLMRAPLDIEPRVSGTFAELRANHFHSGLDLSTSGRTGLPVHAAEAGYVSRIKVSAFGYGKALYIDHPDGTTTVYAHLSAYAGAIADSVRAAQYARQSFEVEIFPKRGALTVERGQIVAYSGNTGGSGGPHLHFEVRHTQSEVPRNPMAYLPPIADHVRPVAHGIKLYALGADAAVGKSQRDVYMQLQPKADGYTTATPATACGEVGFGIHATDYLVQGGSRCGLTSVKLWASDTLIFAARLDSVPFDQTRYINSYVDYAEWIASGRRVQKSFADPGNRLGIYTTLRTLRVEPGRHYDMRYELTDFAGHTTTVSFGLDGRAMTPAPAPRANVRHSRPWHADTLGLVVDMPAGALYADARIGIGTGRRKSNGQTWFAIGTPSVPLHKAIRVALPVPDSLAHMGRRLFAATIDSRGKAAYVGGRLDTDGRLAFETKAMGTFVVSADTAAPRISLRTPVAAPLSPQGTLSIRIDDDMSGIATYACTIDGRWQLFDYDYKTRLLTGRLADFGLAKGAHTLVVSATDNCGNAASATYRFEL